MSPRQLDQFREVGRSEAGNGVPTFGDRETLDVAAMAISLGDIRKALVALLVQPGVQEAKNRLSTCKQRVVDERKDTRGKGARRRSTRNGALGAVPEVGKVETLGRQIGVSAARRVVQTIVEVADGLEVLGHSLLLVRRASKVVAEATAAGVEVNVAAGRVASGAEHGFLRLKVHGCANSRHIWARSGERGQEHGRVFSIVREALVCAAETVVTGGEEERSSSGSDLGKLTAYTLGVGAGNRLLIIAIRRGDDAGDGALVKQPVDPDQVGLVGVCWGEKIRNEGRGATSRERGNGRLPADARNGLHVQVGFATGALDGLVECQWSVLHSAVVDRVSLEAVGLRNGLGTVLLQEHFGIWANRHLAQEVVEGNAVLVAGLGLVPLGLVQILEALGCDRRHVADGSDAGVGGGLVARRHFSSLVNVGGGVGRPTEEGRGGLDGFNVVVEMARQRPRRGTSDDGAVLVPVVVVLGVE